MHDGSIVIATPAQARQLVLLFHGLGSSADNFAPVGGAIARARPDAFVVSVDGPHPSTLGSGREWFSVIGITEENRPERIADAMPLFQESIAHWQNASGIGAGDTTLAGFSQGAIMALESSQIGRPPAARVIALGGRFAQAVRRAPTGLKFHLIHGEQDGVVPARASVEAARALQAAGGDVTLDLLPGLGHGIDARALQLAIGYLDHPHP
ncbi:esterase [Castellaniella ginsengisoli]